MYYKHFKLTNMKASTFLIFLLALAGYLYLSSSDYESEREAAATEQALLRQAHVEQTADSLGLTGQDWINYVNAQCGTD